MKFIVCLPCESLRDIGTVNSDVGKTALAVYDFPLERKKREYFIVIGLGMRIKSRTAEYVHIETDKQNETE